MAEPELLFFVRAEYDDGRNVTRVTRYFPLLAVLRARDPMRRVVGAMVDRLADDLNHGGLWTKSKRRRLVWTTGIERGVWRG